MMCKIIHIYFYIILISYCFLTNPIEVQVPKPRFISLSDRTTNPDIQVDAEFSDKLTALLLEHKTSVLATPFMSQLRRTNSKFRTNIKKRINTYKNLQQNNSDNLNQDDDAFQNENTSDVENLSEGEGFESLPGTSTRLDKDIPKVGEYWTIENGKDQFRYVIIVSEDPLSVNYFDPPPPSMILNKRGSPGGVNMLCLVVW